MKKLCMSAAILLLVGCGSDEKNKKAPLQTTCTPGQAGELRCNNAALETCDGAAWVLQTDCGATGGTCDPAGAAGPACVGGGGCTFAMGVDSCPNGQYCDNGSCVSGNCSGYFSTTCAMGEKCGIVRNGAYECFTDGMGAATSACTAHTDCGPSLVCLQSVCLQPQCEEGSMTNTCTMGMSCVGIVSGGEQLTEGICLNTCTPFGANTCAMNNWCIPDAVDPMTMALTGICIPIGPSLKGQPCATGCAEGLSCVGTSMAGICRTVCDPNAMPMAAGDTCTMMETCNALTSGGNPLPFGACFSGCDFDLGVPCDTPSLSCVPHELITATTDQCVNVSSLNHGDDCSMQMDNTFCGDLKLCTDATMLGAPPMGYPGGLKCWNICRTDIQAAGTMMHPDCPATTDTCTNVGYANLGFCVP